MSFLAIDVGNTRLKWAQYASPQPGAAVLAHGAVFLETIDTLAEGSWHRMAAPRSMLGCNVAGDAVRRRVEEQLELWDIAPRWLVPSAHYGGVVNGYEHPTRLGSDRWAALIGARWHVQQRARLQHGPERPALVVMVGTAVTVDSLDAGGRFIGGLILPGFGLMLRALEQGTSGLRVPTGEVVDFPTNTSDALMSGGAHALAGAIERIHRKLVARCGAEPLLLMTGGAAVKMAPITDLPFETVDSLIFDGLLSLQSHRLAL
jgi:type III pantothenate kinase